MDSNLHALPRLLDRLGLDEPPLGIHYSDVKPEDSLSPQPGDLPTREKELENRIDWQATFANFSCIIGHVWRARNKRQPAVFDAEHFGCPGAAFWLGFMKPQTEAIIHYVSSGIEGQMEGEFYCESPDTMRDIFKEIDPPQASRRYCVVQPLDRYKDEEHPEVVAFFARPEALTGLHQLAAFVTNDPLAVVSPWGAACTGLVTWPFKLLAQGEHKAVLGGWDPSARKFFKTDELSFSVPLRMFLDMLERFEDSFLMTKTWDTVRKKIERSRRTWEKPARH